MKTLINIFILTIITIMSYAQIETKYYLEKDLFPYPVTTIEELQEKSFSTFYVSNKEDESESSIVLKYGNVIRLLNYSNVKNKITSEKWLDKFNQKGILIDSANVTRLTNIAQEYLGENE